MAGHRAAILFNRTLRRCMRKLIREKKLKNITISDTSDPYIVRAKEYYIRKDIQVILHLIEEWIIGGYKETPEELSQFIRLCGARHGKWEYKLAMRHEPDSFIVFLFMSLHSLYLSQDTIIHFYDFFDWLISLD